MKKIFRLFIAGILAVLMCLSVVAFAACGNGNGSRNTISPEETDQLFSDSSYSALGINGTVTMSGMTMNIDGKINLNGNMDIKMTAAGAPSAFKLYMREWKIYMDEGSGLKGIVDLPETIAQYVNEAGEDMMLPVEVTSEMVSSLLVSAKDVIPEVINGYNAQLINYGNAFNGVTVTGDTVTVDINKTLYNQMQGLKTFINGVTADTTISDVLNNDFVKKMCGTILGGSGADFRTELLGTITSLESELEGEEAQVAALIKSLLNSVQPDSGSTVYEYLVKVASSSEFALIVKSALGLTTDKTDITKLTVLELINLMGEEAISASQFNAVLAQYKQQISAVVSGITESACDLGEFALKNSKMVYNLTNKKVSSQTYTCGITVSSEGVKQQIDINTTVTYAKSAYTLDSLTNLPEIDNTPGGSVTGNNLEGKTFMSGDGKYVYFKNGKVYIEVGGAVMCTGDYYADGELLSMGGESFIYELNGSILTLYVEGEGENYYLSDHHVDINNAGNIGPGGPSNPEGIEGNTFELLYLEAPDGSVDKTQNGYICFENGTMYVEAGGEVFIGGSYRLSGNRLYIDIQGQEQYCNYDFDGKYLDLYIVTDSGTGVAHFTLTNYTIDKDSIGNQGGNDPSYKNLVENVTWKLEYVQLGGQGEYAKDDIYYFFKDGVLYTELNGKVGVACEYKIIDGKTLVMAGTETYYSCDGKILSINMPSNSMMMKFTYSGHIMDINNGGNTEPSNPDNPSVPVEPSNPDDSTTQPVSPLAGNKYKVSTMVIDGKEGAPENETCYIFDESTCCIIIDGEVMGEFKYNYSDGLLELYMDSNPLNIKCGYDGKTLVFYDYGSVIGVNESTIDIYLVMI